MGRVNGKRKNFSKWNLVWTTELSFWISACSGMQVGRIKSPSHASQEQEAVCGCLCVLSQFPFQLGEDASREGWRSFLALVSISPHHPRIPSLTSHLPMVFSHYLECLLGTKYSARF
jgi:hypothetical protein